MHPVESWQTLAGKTIYMGVETNCGIAHIWDRLGILLMNDYDS